MGKYKERNVIFVWTTSSLKNVIKYTYVFINNLLTSKEELYNFFSFLGRYKYTFQNDFSSTYSSLLCLYKSVAVDSERIIFLFVTFLFWKIKCRKAEVDSLSISHTFISLDTTIPPTYTSKKKKKHQREYSLKNVQQCRFASSRKLEWTWEGATFDTLYVLKASHNI